MIRRTWFIGSVAAAMVLVAVVSLRAPAGPRPHLCAAGPVQIRSQRHPHAAVQTRATGDAVLQPSAITIHAHDQLLADALASLASQCGADMGVLGSTAINDSRIKKVTLDVDKGSFWDVMLPLCKSAGIGPAPGPGLQRMLLGDRPTGLGGGAPLAVQSGGLLFIPQFAQMARRVDYDDRTRDQAALSVQILVIPEPKIQIVGGQLDNWLEAAPMTRAIRWPAPSPGRAPARSLSRGARSAPICSICPARHAHRLDQGTGKAFRPHAEPDSHD